MEHVSGNQQRTIQLREYIVAYGQRVRAYGILKGSDVRMAREAGCLLTIDTDAPLVADLDLMT